MIEIIGVKFKTNGKVYSFAPGGFSPTEGSYVVVDTVRGSECGIVATRRHAVPEDSVTTPLKPILRLATPEDMAELERNKQYLADAMRVCEEKIAARNLPMRLVDVECGFDSNKLIFYFTADSRVDFRDLVKDLAAAFHVRIELRQIGDRDEAKLLGGLGICGRELCCKGYLDDFQPVTIKMAKEQGMALNPAKISGACGRLMCCLRYESPVYEELIKMIPKAGSTVILPGNPPVRAYVLEANLISGKLRLKPENSELPVTMMFTEVEPLQDTSRRMTREDLRDKRDAAKNASASSKQQSPKSEQRPVQSHDELNVKQGNFGDAPEVDTETKQEQTNQPPRKNNHHPQNGSGNAPKSSSQKPSHPRFRKPKPPRNDADA